VDDECAKRVKSGDNAVIKNMKQLNTKDRFGSVQDKKRKEGLPTETEKGFHGKLPDMTKKPL